MSNDFLVRIEELLLVDEGAFFAAGGEELAFGAVDGDTVELHAEGSRASIAGLARRIAEHHTASV